MLKKNKSILLNALTLGSFFTNTVYGNEKENFPTDFNRSSGCDREDHYKTPFNHELYKKIVSALPTMTEQVIYKVNGKEIITEEIVPNKQDENIIGIEDEKRVVKAVENGKEILISAATEGDDVHQNHILPLLHQIMKRTHYLGLPRTIDLAEKPLENIRNFLRKAREYGVKVHLTVINIKDGIQLQEIKNDENFTQVGTFIPHMRVSDEELALNAPVDDILPDINDEEKKKKEEADKFEEKKYPQSDFVDPLETEAEKDSFNPFHELIGTTDMSENMDEDPIDVSLAVKSKKRKRSDDRSDNMAEGEPPARRIFKGKFRARLGDAIPEAKLLQVNLAAQQPPPLPLQADFLQVNDGGQVEPQPDALSTVKPENVPVYGEKPFAPASLANWGYTKLAVSKPLNTSQALLNSVAGVVEYIKPATRDASPNLVSIYCRQQVRNGKA